MATRRRKAAPLDQYLLTRRRIRNSLDRLAAEHDAIAAAIERVGYPEERRREAGFEAFARIIVGQQVSTKAAASIAAKLTESLGGTLEAAAVDRVDDTVLRGAGLSRQKVSYLRSLSAAVISGDLAVDELAHLDNTAVTEQIVAIRGFGEWSAHMYLMFCLGRPDVWPSGDLAVRAGLGRILGVPERPTPRQTEALALPFAPERSALALLCWKYYSEAPL